MFIEEQVADLTKKVQELTALVEKQTGEFVFPEKITNGMVFMRHDGSLWLSVFPTAKPEFCLVCVKTGMTYDHMKGFGDGASQFKYIGPTESFSMVRLLGKPS